MASFRVGNVANALSGGIGLFAEKAMREEEERIDREWQLTLANLQETRAASREERQYAHAESLAKTREEAATKRYTAAQESEAARHKATVDATAAFRQATMTAEGERFSQGRVDDARESLRKTLLELEERMQKELEDPMVKMDATAKDAVIRRYVDLKDQAITGTVAWLASQKLPGYEVDSEKALQSLLIQSGMDVPGAKQHAAQIWQSIGPQSPDLITAANAPGAQNRQGAAAPQPPPVTPPQRPTIPEPMMPGDPKNQSASPPPLTDPTALSPWVHKTGAAIGKLFEPQQAPKYQPGMTPEELWRSR